MSPENMETSIADDLSKIEFKYSIVQNEKLSNGARFKILVVTKIQIGINLARCRFLFVILRRFSKKKRVSKFLIL